ncbi:MAG TPA: UvrD-helicase domain-containing protein [Gammaproteobacteria bacterium]|nr:UvrD-helicase domain-containing protein [Gammaproteobacteria bacterium]HRP87732.1 UvrD-helicase domain-containing protein [Gammaproteobacteria bacterium]
MTERRPEDQAVREAALDPARSFIVQAPAGSGKTELLTRRFLRLLAVVERPEEIVAITFTRKAAGEMRSRILDALQLGESLQAPAEAHRREAWSLARDVLARDRAQHWGLLDNPRRLRIETIDALNAWLARQLPMSSRLGAAPVVTDNAEPVYQQTARDILLAAGGDEAHAPHAAALLVHLGGRFGQAQALLVAMLKARDHWLGKIVPRKGMQPSMLRKTLNQALHNFVEDELRRVHAELWPEMLDELAELAAGAAARAPQIDWLEPFAGATSFPAPSAEALPRWRAVAELLLTKEGQWRKTLNKHQGFPPDAKSEKQRMRELLQALAEGADPAGLQRVRELPAPAYDAERWAILEHLLALLPVCAAALDVDFAGRGESDYVGIAQAALAALGDDRPTDLALALDCRISHLLVDEFQDTSQAQVELLARLTAGWVPGDGRTLFCVGDPMQSIYRFREADVGRFLRAQRTGIGQVTLQRLRLGVNFRSQASLVDWVSTSFPDIFPRREDLSLGAVPFAPSVAWHPALPGPAVNCHAAPPGDSRTEAARVAGIIAGIRQAAPAASIAVLVRSRSHLAHITPALKAAAIPFQAVEIEPLAEVPAIRDLEALTRALCHRADRTAWLAILRAPWCGLPLAELLAVAGGRHDEIWARLQDPEVLAGLSEDGRARVARLVVAIAPALEERGRRPLRRVVEGAWLALGGPATLERESELADARTFLEYLDGRAPHGDLDDPPGLTALLGDLYAAPEAITGTAVQLLTIHKAKGLEFDHVILPGLDRSTGRNEKRLLRWLEQVREEGTELILAPVERFGDEQDPLHRALRQLDDRRAQLELDRLLYVAVTRARERLHLVARLRPDDPDSGQPPRPRSGTLLERLWPALGDAFLAAREPVGNVPGEGAARPPAKLRRYTADWSPPVPLAAVHWTAAEAEPAAPGAVVEYDWSGREARAVGVAVHRLLQVISTEGPDAWPEARLRAATPLLRALLSEAGLGRAELDAALARSSAVLARTLADARGRWLLDPGHADSSSERRISGRLDGRVVQGIVDRSFLDESGVLWIIDYKTGRHEGAELDAFLDREQERYRAQLERYARMLAARHAGPIRMGLYFPQLSGWREWGAGDPPPDRETPAGE